MTMWKMMQVTDIITVLVTHGEVSVLKIIIAMHLLPYQCSCLCCMCNDNFASILYSCGLHSCWNPWAKQMQRLSLLQHSES